MAGISVRTEFTDLADIREQFQRLPQRASAEYYQKAIKAALEPARARLVQLTPIGPTGNLRASNAIKTQRYNQTGNAIGLLGYRRAGREPSVSTGGSVKVGKDRAFHQGWIEFGAKPKPIKTKSTKPYTRRAHVRQTRSGQSVSVATHVVQKGQNAYIASSWNRRGPFSISAGADGRAVASTKSGFFVKKSEPIKHDGIPAQAPIKRTFEQTQGQIAEILRQRLTVSLQEALDAIANRPSDSFSTLGLNETS